MDSRYYYDNVAQFLLKE